MSDAVGSKATLYVVAIVALCIVSAGFVLAITFVRPDADNAGVIASVLGVIAPVVVALLAATVQQVHLLVNSRLSQLVELTAKAARAEGKLDGAAAAVSVASEVARAEGVEQERVRVEGK